MFKLDLQKMFDLFGEVKDLFKLDSTTTDNNVFLLHYKVTGIILLSCSILVTSKTYIGDPIDCIVEEIEPDVSVLNLYTYLFKMKFKPRVY